MKSPLSLLLKNKKVKRAIFLIVLLFWIISTFYNPQTVAAQSPSPPSLTLKYFGPEFYIGERTSFLWWSWNENATLVPGIIKTSPDPEIHTVTLLVSSASDGAIPIGDIIDNQGNLKYYIRYREYRAGETTNNVADSSNKCNTSNTHNFSNTNGVITGISRTYHRAHLRSDGTPSGKWWFSAQISVSNRGCVMLDLIERRFAGFSGPIAGQSNPVPFYVNEGSSGTWGGLFGILRALWEGVIFLPKFFVGLMGDFFENLGIWVVKTFTDIVVRFFKWLADLSAQLFKYLLSEFIGGGRTKWAITRGSGESQLGKLFLTSWNIVKAYANIVIVLLFIAGATMMMLRLWVDRAKKLLPQVILIALLINFSVVFVGVMLDVSNILTSFLAEGGQGQILTIEKLSEAYNTVVFPISTPKDFGAALTYFFFGMIFATIFGFVAFLFLYFCFIIIKRYIMLAALFILSPLAFTAAIFPHESVSKLWSTWWHHFLKQLFILVPAMFFLMISTMILTSDALPGLKSDYKPNISNLAPLLFSLAIVLGFLWAGLKLANESAGPFAESVMGMAKSVGVGVMTVGAGWAAKGAMWAVRTGATYTGLRAGLRKAGAGLTRVGEKMWVPGYGRLVKKGTADVRWQTRRQAEIKKHTEPAKQHYSQLSAAQFAQAGNDIVRRKYNTNQEIGDAVGFAQAAIADPEKWKALAPKKQREIFKLLRDKAGGAADLNQLTRLSPELSGLHTERMNQVMQSLVGKTAKGSINNPKNKTGRDIEYTQGDIDKPGAVLYDQIREEAAQRLQKENYARKPEDKDLMKLSTEEKAQHLARKIQTGKKVSSDEAQMIDYEAREGKLGKLAKAFADLGVAADAADAIQKLSNQMNHMQDQFGSTAFDAIKSKDWRFAEHNNQEVKKVTAQRLGISANEVTDDQITNEDRTNERKNAIGGLNAGNVRDMHYSAMDTNFLSIVDEKTLQKAGVTGNGFSREQKEALAKAYNYLSDADKQRVAKSLNMAGINIQPPQQGGGEGGEPPAGDGPAPTPTQPSGPPSGIGGVGVATSSGPTFQEDAPQATAPTTSPTVSQARQQVQEAENKFQEAVKRQDEITESLGLVEKQIENIETMGLEMGTQQYEELKQKQQRLGEEFRTSQQAVTEAKKAKKEAQKVLTTVESTFEGIEEQLAETKKELKTAEQELAELEESVRPTVGNAVRRIVSGKTRRNVRRVEQGAIEETEELVDQLKKRIKELEEKKASMRSIEQLGGKSE